MIVEFRDATLSDNTKNVTGLRIEDFDNSDHVLDGYSITSEDQMLLPLKTDANETKYIVYSDYANTNDVITGNPDVITITYERKEIYVSRACGYKTIFENVLLTIEPEAGSDNWMLFAVSENENQSVINEDEIHYTIRH